MKIAKSFAIMFILATVMTSFSTGFSSWSSDQTKLDLSQKLHDQCMRELTDKAKESAAKTLGIIIIDQNIAQNIARFDFNWRVCYDLSTCISNIEMKYTDVSVTFEINESIIREELEYTSKEIKKEIEERQKTLENIKTQKAIIESLEKDGLVERGKITVLDVRRHAAAVMTQIEIFVKSREFKNTMSINWSTLLEDVLRSMSSTVKNNNPDMVIKHICSNANLNTTLKLRLFDEDVVTAVLRERLIRVYAQSQSGENSEMKKGIRSSNFDTYLMDVSHNTKESPQSWTGLTSITTGNNFYDLCVEEEEFYDKTIGHVILETANYLFRRANYKTQTIIHEGWNNLNDYYRKKDAKEFFKDVAQNEKVVEKSRAAAKKALEDIIFTTYKGRKTEIVIDEALEGILMDEDIAKMISEQYPVKKDICLHLDACLKSKFETINSGSAGYTEIMKKKDAGMSKSSKMIASIKEVMNKTKKELKGNKVDTKHGLEVCKQLEIFVSSETFKGSVKEKWRPVLQNVLLRVNQMILIHAKSDLEGWDENLMNISTRIGNIIPEELVVDIADVCLSDNNAQEYIGKALFDAHVIDEIVKERLKRNKENIETDQQEVCNLDTYLLSVSQKTSGNCFKDLAKKIVYH